MVMMDFVDKVLTTINDKPVYAGMFVIGFVLYGISLLIQDYKKASLKNIDTVEKPEQKEAADVRFLSSIKEKLGRFTRARKRSDYDL